MFNLNFGEKSTEKKLERKEFTLVIKRNNKHSLHYDD